MKLRFLNKTIQNKRFDYTPMYYDERKERLERKKEQYKRAEDGTISEEERRSIFKENMQSEWSRSKIRQEHTRSSNLRTIFLICLILGLGYIIFNSVDEVDTVVNKIW